MLLLLMSELPMGTASSLLSPFLKDLPTPAAAVVVASAAAAEGPAVSPPKDRAANLDPPLTATCAREAAAEGGVGGRMPIACGANIPLLEVSPSYLLLLLPS
jgi:hypothetical protein